MPILMAVMLVIIWAQSVISIYALVNPFIDEMGNMQHYNVAYYGAIAWVERAELALRWHTAWFEWSWWWLDKNTYGPDSDHSFIDKEHFWLLALTGLNYGTFWQIKSMSNWSVIPEPWKWDLDQDISDWNNFYRLSFDRSIQMALYEDITGRGCWDLSDYYTWVDENNCIKNIKFGNWLKASIKVPQKLYELYEKDYNRNKQLADDVDIDGDGITNDIVVNRSLFGYTGDTQFTIFPTVDVDNSWKVKDDDTNIREDVVNAYSDTNTGNIYFNTTSDKSNPIPSRAGQVDKFNQSPEDAVSTWFNKILNDNSDKISKMHVKFSLVNLLKYNESLWYPYLEISIFNEDNKQLPDIFYHIKWEAKVWAYDVRIKINKPVFDVNAASDFTVMF